jgi:hypothetical protein
MGSFRCRGLTKSCWWKEVSDCNAGLSGHLDTWRGCQPDRSLLNNFEYTAYFSWQNIGAASATVSFVVHVAAVGEFIFTESCIFSVNIIPPLFYAFSFITDAEIRLKFNTSLNKTHKCGTVSFVSTSRSQILFRLFQEQLASSSVSDNIIMLDLPVRNTHRQRLPRR